MEFLNDSAPEGLAHAQLGACTDNVTIIFLKKNVENK